MSEAEIKADSSASDVPEPPGRAGPPGPGPPGPGPPGPGPPGPAAPPAVCVPPPPPMQTKPPTSRAGPEPFLAGSPTSEPPVIGGAAEPGRGLPPGVDGEGEELVDGQVVKSAPPWLLSTVIHLIVLLALALSSRPTREGISNLMLAFAQGEQELTVDLDVFSLEANDNIDDAPEETMMETDVSQALEATNLAEKLELVELAPLDLGAAEKKIELTNTMFGGRTGSMRKTLLSLYGGTPETEEAVALGLKWLKRNQNSDGGWNMQGPFTNGSHHGENRCAATAMALLAFLGDGSTHLRGTYAKEVEAGVKFLIKQQDRSGFMANDAVGHDQAYAQAQATIALCELYGMTQDSWVRPAAQLALDYAIEAQSKGGGWRYQPRVGQDTSVTGWFVMALQSGKSGGLEVDEAKLSRVANFLETVQSDDGAAYSYVPGNKPSPAMTAEGLLCRQYLGWGRDHPPMQRGVNELLDDAPFSMRQNDVYYWYYATQVMHHIGGSPWRLWNQKMRDELPKAQVKSGKESGSWDPLNDNRGRSRGRLYTTCLSLYCLEVYYRHMPLYSAQVSK